MIRQTRGGYPRHPAQTLPGVVFKKMLHTRIVARKIPGKKLFADKPYGAQRQYYFIHDNRRITMKKPIQDTAANNRRYAANNQHAQLSADSHHLSPCLSRSRRSFAFLKSTIHHVQTKIFNLMLLSTTMIQVKKKSSSLRNELHEYESIKLDGVVKIDTVQKIESIAITRCL